MKRLLTSLLFLSLAYRLCLAQEAGSVRLDVKGTTLQVTFISPEIVHVVRYPSGSTGPTRKSMVVTLQPDAALAVQKSETPSRMQLSSSALTVSIDKRSGLLQFLSKGRNLLREKQFGFEERQSGPDRGAYRVTQVYQLDKDEPLYGLGTIQDGLLNRRGTSKHMEQSNLEDFQYVVQSLKGWGLYWDNYSRADFSDSAEGMTFSAEVGDAIDYYFMLGGSADGVNAQMRKLSGQVPMFPLWTFGYWQCRERYKTSRELLEVVQWHRDNGVPLDGIVQDWQYWGNNYLWNAMDFLNESFSDGREMVEKVHKMNAHLMISIWASFGPQTKAYAQLKEKGLLYDFETWPQSGISHLWPPRMDYPSGVKVYDALSAEARDIYWQHLRTLNDYGIDAWWMDSTDPDYFNPKDSEYDHTAGDGTWRRYRNAFPLASVSGVYDHLRAETPGKRVFIMTRSAFAGQQRYGSGLWSGDVGSSWDMLRKQIPLGLNYAMTGCPNFNTDIGGFFCGSYNTDGPGSAPRNPQFQELYVRWMQYALFCPVFRSHGADAPREIYQFGKRGEPVFDAIEHTIRLRYSLLPYIYSLAWDVTSHNGTYQRALVYDFPGDRRVWNLTDEFLFGHSILVAPIVRPQYTEEKVMNEDAMSGWDKKAATGSTGKPDFTQEKTATCYLPKGADWYDFRTGKCYRGGRDVTITTRLSEAPTFVRAGSIIPMAPPMTYAKEKPWDNLDVVVYPGADADFLLYEDEGDGYRYEQGAYTTIRLHWDDARRQLTIGTREGTFPGMLQSRTFHVRLSGSQAARTVSYTGTETVVDMR